MTNSFTLVFIIALSLTVCLRVWLAWRQIRHVRQHRDHVPLQFADRITLAAHQKAADYCLARTRIGFIALTIEIALLLAWTLGGGLQYLYEFWSARLGDGLSGGLALIFSVTAISGLIDLPLSLYLQFVVESLQTLAVTDIGV